MDNCNKTENYLETRKRKTILDDLKEKYPNYQRSFKGETPSICPYKLGYEEYETANKNCFATTCAECWNRPLDEVMKDNV